jgi:hypothetical protein
MYIGKMWDLLKVCLWDLDGMKTLNRKENIIGGTIMMSWKTLKK